MHAVQNDMQNDISGSTNNKFSARSPHGSIDLYSTVKMVELPVIAMVRLSILTM